MGSFVWIGVDPRLSAASCVLPFFFSPLEAAAVNCSINSFIRQLNPYGYLYFPAPQTFGSPRCKRSLHLRQCDTPSHAATDFQRAVDLQRPGAIADSSLARPHSPPSS